MNLGVLIAVLLYEVISIAVVTVVLTKRNKNKQHEEGSFAFAGGGLPASLVGITLALTLLGSAHNWGTCQNAASMGRDRRMVWYRLCCHDGSDHTGNRSLDAQNRRKNSR